MNVRQGTGATNHPCLIINGPRQAESSPLQLICRSQAFLGCHQLAVKILQIIRRQYAPLPQYLPFLAHYGKLYAAAAYIKPQNCH